MAVLLTLLTSCSLTSKQQTGVSTFGSASESLAQVIREELPKLRSQVIEFNRNSVQLDGVDGAGLTGSETVLNVKVLNFDGALDPKVMRTAVRAAEGLLGYAQALKALVDYDGSTDLQEEADKLGDSIRGVSLSGGQVLDDPQIDALEAGIRDIGGFYINYKKRKAVNRIVTAYQDVIPKLTQQLRHDFNPAGAGFSSQLFIRTKDVLNKSIIALSADGMTPSERAFVLDIYDVAVASLRHQDLILREVSMTCTKLDDANKELVELLDNDDVHIGAIKDFYNSAKDIADSAKILFESR